GASLLAGGLKHRIQHYNRENAHLLAGLLFLATIALMVPSVLIDIDFEKPSPDFTHRLSLALSVLLIVSYGLSMLFALGTHREIFGSVAHAHDGDGSWPIGLSLAMLAVATVLMSFASEVFVGSVQ